MTPYTDHFETMQESYQRYEKNNRHFEDQSHLDEFISCLKVATHLRIQILIKSILKTRVYIFRRI